MLRIKYAIAVCCLALTMAGCASNRTMGERLDDATITTKVKTALAIDPTAKARQINVDTHDGIVQLNGFVDTPQAKQVAERIARHTAGVTRVENNLEVKTSDRSFKNTVSDEVLEARVKTALVADPATPARKISVEVHDGAVQLGGFVDSEQAKDDATSAAKAVAGVTSVENSLDVRGH